LAFVAFLGFSGRFGILIFLAYEPSYSFGSVRVWMAFLVLVAAGLGAQIWFVLGWMRAVKAEEGASS